MADTILPQKRAGPIVDDNQEPIYENADYHPILSNWFTAKPYGFRFTPKEDASKAKVMYLPIGPSNLIITTQFATNITPTIYGTVEEHSPVRYFDISIEGTTGMGPKYTAPMYPDESPIPLSGRTSFTVQQTLVDKTQGFFAKTLNTVDKIYNDVTAIAVNFKPTSPVSGIPLDQTGYIAFHNLYRFFLKYKKDASGEDNQIKRKYGAPHPLVFFNYKDNNEYNVIIRSFTLRRDKENPMLYFYSINMRGYALKRISGASGVNDIQGTNELLANLGLNGVQNANFLAKAKDIASQARNVLASVANGVNQLGR